MSMASKRLGLVLFMVLAVASVWIYIGWCANKSNFPPVVDLYRIVLTLEIAIFSTLLVPIAYFAKRGNHMAYRVLRSATGLMWVFTGCFTGVIIVATKGHVSEWLTFVSASDQNAKAVGDAILRVSCGYIVSFILNAVSYFLLASKSVVALFSNTQKADGK